MLPLIVDAASAPGVRPGQIAVALDQTSVEWCESGSVLRVTTRPLMAQQGPVPVQAWGSTLKRRSGE